MAFVFFLCERLLFWRHDLVLAQRESKPNRYCPLPAVPPPPSRVRLRVKTVSTYLMYLPCSSRGLKIWNYPRGRYRRHHHRRGASRSAIVFSYPLESNARFIADRFVWSNKRRRDELPSGCEIFTDRPIGFRGGFDELKILARFFQLGIGWIRSAFKRR